MSNLIIADNSNLWIEGQAAAALEFPTMHENERALDREWHLDFSKLLNFCLSNSTSTFASKSVVLLSRSYSKQKYLNSIFDEVLLFDNDKPAAERAYAYVAEKLLSGDLSKSAEVTLAAGSGSYIPLVEALKKHQIKTKVVFWSNAHRDLKAIADQFVDLSSCIGELSFHRDIPESEILRDRRNKLV